MSRLKLEDQLCFALYAATNAVTRAYRPRLADHGLSYPQYLVLLVLWQNGALKPGEIARRLGLAPSAITPLITRLESAGLVERQRDVDDLRVVHVALTSDGRALEDRIARVQNEVQCETGLSPSALADLRQDLADLVLRMTPAAEEA